MVTKTSFPGVYIEEDTSLALSVSQGDTAIPVFIGRFSSEENNSPLQVIRVSSWLDFTTQYPLNPVSISITSTPINPSVQLEEKPIIDAAATNISVVYKPSYDALRLYFQNGGGPCYILSLKDINDEKTLAKIPELIEQAANITLLICPELDATYKNTVYASLSPLLNNPKYHGKYFLIADTNIDGEGKPAIPASLVEQDQAAIYYPLLKIRQPEDKNVNITGYKDTAITNLAQLKVKDENTYQEVIQKIQDAKVGIVSTSAVIAGVYCATDANRGIWKAPANVVLNGISDVTKRITDDEQGTISQDGINAIRYFNNRGFVVWGARTLKDDDNWRYIPVRRLFNSAERDIRRTMQFAIFEPNSQPTWERVRSAIENYLYQLWQQGALTGNKPQEAYFVQIGKDITMSDNDIKQGKMIIKVGIAAVRPAEFIILQFSQNVAQ
ncbi:phage tail sheath family protein [Photorhabdus luminescens]|uniref:Phage tail sheath family protein n=1 Tax=Photorhabdus luminescens subsp. mexicana TaxID=2100167 RepID=A0A4R4JH35_PHOLU|nr:phage tail sheath C-terminal domain-containing protein [Photorhabdus luminescens]TDB53527.1 phage tail sheath family protein [Photorhabdus luminescens subsp. mexicana]